MNFKNFLFPNTITWPDILGKNIYLKDFNNDYLDKLESFLKDPDVFKFSFGAPKDFNINEISEKYIKQVAANKGRTLGIFTKDKDDFIGVIHVFFTNYFIKTYKFGIMIGDKDFWNKGLGKEATSIMVKHLFEKERAHCVALETADFNIRAQRCFEKCGFKKIKTFNEFDAYTKQHANKVLYKITRSSYGSSRPGF